MDGQAMRHDWLLAVLKPLGIGGPLRQLGGEHDLNFRAATAEGDVIVKAMRQRGEPALVERQCAALAHASAADPGLPLPQVLAFPDGLPWQAVRDDEGQSRIVWVQRSLDGIAMGEAGPQQPAVLAELGALAARLDRALEGFALQPTTEAAKWDLLRAGWIRDRLDVLDGERRQLVAAILADYDRIFPRLAALPAQALHNDLNDYNILVVPGLTVPARISGLIDFGDMTVGPRICGLAIAAAYAILDHETPEAALAALIAGYHAVAPLASEDIELIWPLLRMRLAVSVVNSAIEAVDRPDDPYVTISQAPAWRLLENKAIDGALIGARLRAACGLPVTDNAERILAWLDANRGDFAPVLGVDLDDAEVVSLAVEDSILPENPFDLRADEARRLTGAVDDRIRLGRYGEPRLVYTDRAFRKGPWKASNRRTVHMAVDIFAPAGQAVHAPLAGKVAMVEYRANPLDYGGVVIMEHRTGAGEVFYALYGHLDPAVCDSLKVGDEVAAGAVFAKLGAPQGNGGWEPHLHFQLALTLDGMGHDWPGVADPDDWVLWRALCPNPAALLNLPEERVACTPVDTAELLAERRARFGSNLKLSYRRPVTFLRGWRHHLFDEMGRPYLDAYNNVPHVGHAHPRIRAVACDQLARMNSNTRYLHPAQTALAERLTARLPQELEICFFVNSGSEANELALRLARAASGGYDIVTPDHGYHGNTTGAIDISAYKFNKPGMHGRRPWVHLVDVADDYRGRFRRDDPDRARRYAGQVDAALAEIEQGGGRLAGFIAETFPSVGGQIIPPQGYLAEVYRRIRAAGGICIADEVQTGLGRLGDFYFGFEQQKVRPDIVVLGKPLGNGHPVGAVITTRAIAERFAEGPEYFSTFGGSNLSCRIAAEVLDIVDDEDLQGNARRMGERLLSGMRELGGRHEVVGDVRGIGLFTGLDLVTDRESRNPATDVADYVTNRLRDLRILVGREGPADNILKIRPPLTIGADDVDMLLDRLDLCLKEAGTALRATKP
ncbi:aminotransferase class III-fold pyridoxal phosphate-dependent enzyme [Aquamicrobium terrae]|uniref:4-aminobutyrate aminotransferase-like enzyme/Ser/Thr protein kinase RdoA (MazF antagonist) n=1 Tax=Aquamicrobium terrae TaxID=1324945 RepID=A0ABV2N2Z8_9HYPH